MLASRACATLGSNGEVVLVLRAELRLGGRDHVAAHEVGEALVQRLHADILAGLDRRIHLRDLVLADQVADGGGADHDLVRGHAARTVLGLEQGLRDHRAQRFGQHRAHHVLFRRGEDVDDTVDGLGGGRGVQRAEHEVAGFRRGQRQADGLQVAHFAHQDHVRVLAQGGAQRVVEGHGVAVHLALVDQAALGFMHEFDRVLDGEDVAVLVLVDVVDHRRERGRFAGAGRAGNQYDAARLVGDLLEDLRAVQLFERQHLGRNGPEHGAGAAVLVERVYTEAGEVGNREREIALPGFLELLALPVVHDVVHHGMHFLVLHGRQVDAAHVAMHTDHGRQARRKVKVGSLVLDGEGEEFGDVHRIPLTSGCEKNADARMLYFSRPLPEEKDHGHDDNFGPAAGRSGPGGRRCRGGRACARRGDPACRQQDLAGRRRARGRRCGAAGLRRELRAGGRRQDRCAARTRSRVALHRPAAKQQDPAGRKRFRLGAQHRPAEDRRAPVGAARRASAAAQCLHPGQCQRRRQQERRRSGRSRRARARRRGLATFAAARPDVHSRTDRGSRPAARALCRAAHAAGGTDRRGPCARHAVDGHVARHRARHRRRRHDRACRHGDFRRAHAPGRIPLRPSAWHGLAIHTRTQA
ncbi:twitching motility protein PilT [Thauera sp. 63]|nr:twitching motility protein PilT [Thauera sp. 63]